MKRGNNSFDPEYTRQTKTTSTNPFDDLIKQEQETAGESATKTRELPNPFKDFLPQQENQQTPILKGILKSISGASSEQKKKISFQSPDNPETKEFTPYSHIIVEAESMLEKIEYLKRNLTENLHETIFEKAHELFRLRKEISNTTAQIQKINRTIDLFPLTPSIKDQIEAIKEELIKYNETIQTNYKNNLEKKTSELDTTIKEYNQRILSTYNDTKLELMELSITADEDKLDKLMQIPNLIQTLHEQTQEDLSVMKELLSERNSTMIELKNVNNAVIKFYEIKLAECKAISKGKIDIKPDRSPDNADSKHLAESPNNSPQDARLQTDPQRTK